MQKNLANPMTRFREISVLTIISRWIAGLAIAPIGPVGLNFVDSCFDELSHYATN